MIVKIDKITIRKPEQRVSKKQVKFWTFYILLGKNKGTLNCILYDAKIEMLKEGDVLMDITADLTKQKVNDRWYDKLFIKEYHLPSEYVKKDEPEFVSTADLQLTPIGDEPEAPLEYKPFEEDK